MDQVSLRSLNHANHMKSMGLEPKDLWWNHYHEAFRALGEIRGFPAPQRASFDYEANGGGALFVGSPEEIAERIVALHAAMKHDRHFFQMDLGQLPQKDFLSSIELLGTKVKPLVDAALAEQASVPETV